MNHQDDEWNLDADFSSGQYKEALKACRPLFKGDGNKNVKMLKANYEAPDHTITAGELAEALGFANFNAANLLYGKLAGEVARQLGLEPGSLRGLGVETTWDVAVLVSFSGGAVVGKEVGWTLLPALVQALEEMKWVKPSA